MKAQIETYKNANDALSVYLLTNDEYSIEEAYDFLIDNYEDHGSLELVDEDDEAVAGEYGYKHCVIFHKTVQEPIEV